MTEPTEIDDVIRKGMEKLERLDNFAPLQALSKDELNKHLRLMYRAIVAIQAECNMLKVWVDELKANQAVAENSTGVDDKAIPEEPTSE